MIGEVYFKNVNKSDELISTINKWEKNNLNPLDQPYYFFVSHYVPIHSILYYFDLLKYNDNGMRPIENSKSLNLKKCFIKALNNITMD